MYISLLNKLVIFSSLFLLAGFSNSEEIEKWRLTLPLGKVFVQETDSSYWSRGTLNQYLANNNKIKTEVKSRCELKNREKHVLRIGELSLVEINYNDQNENSIHTLKGKIWYNIPGKGGSRKTKIRTPTAVAAIRGTTYSLNLNENVSDHYVYNGIVNIIPLKEDGITEEDTTIIVRSGEVVKIVKDFDQYLKEQERLFLEFKDEYEVFKLKQAAEFENFLKKERDAFKRFKNLSISKTKIDSTKDLISEWVKWNKELDDSLE